MSGTFSQGIYVLRATSRRLKHPGFGATRRTGFLAAKISVPEDSDRMASAGIAALFETDE